MVLLKIFFSGINLMTELVKPSCRINPSGDINSYHLSRTLTQLRELYIAQFDFQVLFFIVGHTNKYSSKMQMKKGLHKPLEV